MLLPPKPANDQDRDAAVLAYLTAAGGGDQAAADVATLIVAAADNGVKNRLYRAAYEASASGETTGEIGDRVEPKHVIVRAGVGTSQGAIAKDDNGTWEVVAVEGDMLVLEPYLHEVQMRVRFEQVSGLFD